MAKISSKIYPDYVAKELEKGPQQPIDFRMVSSVKSGLKCGRKLSDADSRWVEKWFEIKCKDVAKGGRNEEIVTDIIVKSYSKLWTNIKGK